MAVVCFGLVSHGAARGEKPVFEAAFSGPGGGTGGPSDLVATGGTGQLHPSSAGEIQITTETSLGAGGCLLAIVRKPDSGKDRAEPQVVVLTPASLENSYAGWASLQDGRWNVSGAVDFFFSPDFDVNRLGQFLPLKTGRNPGGLALMIRNIPDGESRGAFCAVLEGPPNVFGPGKSKVVVASSSERGDFALRGGTENHLALTMHTDAKTGETILRLYGREDLGEISTEEGSPDLLGETAFSIHPAAVKAAHLFSPGSFEFGNLDGRGINENLTPEKAQRFDTLRIYRAAPASFPAAGQPR